MILFHFYLCCTTMRSTRMKPWIKVVEYYKKLKDIISTNDGTRSFIIRTEDCHDQNAPFNQSQETRLKITHSDHMISQITEGFINFKIKLTIQLSKDIQSTHVNDTEKLGKNTHTQCVLHIIRLRLIIFHTPKNFHGRNKIE